MYHISSSNVHTFIGQFLLWDMTHNIQNIKHYQEICVEMLNLGSNEISNIVVCPAY